MQEIQDGVWWRMLLKDAATRLYARVDLIKQSDSSLDIIVNIQELSSQIKISFEEGSVVIRLLRQTGGDVKEVSREEIKLNGRFVWKEEDNSNEG